jgi:hypothetical protein
MEKITCLVVKLSDFDTYGDWLEGEAAAEFMRGKYTHTVYLDHEGNPVVGEAHVVAFDSGGHGVQTGEQVSNHHWRD